MKAFRALFFAWLLMPIVCTGVEAAGVDPLLFLSASADVVAVIEIRQVFNVPGRVDTLRDQQAKAFVVKQLAGKRTEERLVIWNKDYPNSRNLPVLRPGRYMAFLNLENDGSYVRCIEDSSTFAEILDGFVLWRNQKIPLEDAIRRVSRSD
jgi:hypothetical protein